jgi:hypothetical protein
MDQVHQADEPGAGQAEHGDREHVGDATGRAAVHGRPFSGTEQQAERVTNRRLAERRNCSVSDLAFSTATHRLCSEPATYSDPSLRLPMTNQSAYTS